MHSQMLATKYTHTYMHKFRDKSSICNVMVIWILSQIIFFAMSKVMYEGLQCLKVILWSSFGYELHLIWL